MPLVARATFLVLVGATFSAFFVAQRLKSTGPVIEVKGLATFFSPNGDGEARHNGFSVVLQGARRRHGRRRQPRRRPRQAARRGPRRARLQPAAAELGRHDRRRAGARRTGSTALRVTLRDEGRSAIVQKTMNVDTRAPVSEVCVGFRCTRQGARATSSPRATARCRSTSRASRRTTPRSSGSSAPTRASRARSASCRASRAGRTGSVWDGPGRRQAAGPRDLHRPVRGARHRGQRRDHAGRVRGRHLPRAARGSPCAGSPPARRCARSPRAGGPSSRSTRAARPTAGACAGWATPRSASAAARRRTCSPSARRPGPSGVYLLELRSGRWHTTVPFLVQAEKRSSVLVVVPDDQLARHRQGRRPAVRRASEHALRRRHGALAARVRRRGGPAGRVRRRHRAAARLPRPPPHPVRPHE